IAQIGSRLESAVAIRGARPRDAPRRWNVATAQSAFLRVVGHVELLAGVLVRRPDVDELAVLIEMATHVLHERTNRLVAPLAGLVARAIEAWHFRRHRPPLAFPLRAAAIEDARVREPKQLEDPERVGRPPVVLVA